jgi:hypothetical protein
MNIIDSTDYSDNMVEYFTSVLSGHYVPTKWFAVGEQPHSVSVNSSSDAMTSSHPLDDDLDISWLNEHSSIHDIQKNYCREPMNKINVSFVYINEHSYIEKMINETHDIVVDDSLAEPRFIIPKERVLHMIQTKKRSNPYSKYKLLDMLLYNVDLEPEQIQSFSKTMVVANDKQFLHVLPLFDDIVISPSIFIFHSLNSLFFIFKEYVHDFNIKTPPTIKPILKQQKNESDSVEPSKSKHTKKVRIVIPDQHKLLRLPSPEISKRQCVSVPTDNRHTRKNIPKILT